MAGKVHGLSVTVYLRLVATLLFHPFMITLSTTYVPGTIAVVKLLCNVWPCLHLTDSGLT